MFGAVVKMDLRCAAGRAKVVREAFLQQTLHPSLFSYHPEDLWPVQIPTKRN